MVDIIELDKSGKGKKSITQIEGELSYVDCFGIPQPELLKASGFNLADVPKDKIKKREYYLLWVECLMLQGEYKHSRIGKLLKIKRATAKKYMEQIECRWSLKSTADTKVLHGKAKARLELITRKIFEIIDSKNCSDSKKIGCFRTLLKVHNSLLICDGLTPDALESFATNPIEPEVGKLNLSQERILELTHVLDAYLKPNPSEESGLALPKGMKMK